MDENTFYHFGENENSESTDNEIKETEEMETEEVSDSQADVCEETSNLSSEIDSGVEDRENNLFNSHEMTEEEIKKAAENIGTPLTSYEYNSTGSTSYGAGASENHAEPSKPEKKHPFLKVLKFLAIAACFGLVAGATFFGVENALNVFFFEDSSAIDSEGSGTIGETIRKNDKEGVQNLNVGNLVIAGTKTAEQGISDNDTVVDVVKQNMSCTVAISAVYTTMYQDFFGMPYSYESQGGGSGFIVGMNDTELLVATNNHVVSTANKLQVVFSDGTSIDGTVRSTDADNDLAIVSVALKDIPEATAKIITVARLGDSDAAEIGEMVIAIGNALGYGQSVTVGYLSAKDREVTISDVTQKLLQTDAAINEGNSGGPLFNVKGEVIGINCAKLADTSVEGMCFAIPITVAIPVLKDLMKDVIPEAEQGYLGVTIKTITQEYADFYGWPTTGVYIYSVVEGGSAEKAGIYVGDIVTAIDGKTTKTSEKLKSVVNSYRVGETLTVTLMRNENGEWVEKNISVTLMAKPEES